MGKDEALYTIIESDSGPMISRSRISVYDVLEAEERGKSFFEICLMYELLPIQVELAQAYIREHREIILSELHQIQADKRERELHYRAVQEEIRAQLEDLPPDSIRQKMLELRAKYTGGNGHLK